MKIDYSNTRCFIEISDEEMASWRNGEEEFYKMDKDKRPDINPYDFALADQDYYKLRDLALTYGINKTPKDVEYAVENVFILGKLYNKYVMHTLALCLDKFKEQK